MGVRHRVGLRTDSLLERARAGVRRSAAGGGDVYRCHAAMTGDRTVSVAGYQRWGLADSAGHMSYAAIVIGHGEVERTSRYVGVRSVTIIWRSATRSGDVYRSRPTKTADGIMRLAGTQRVGLTDVSTRGRGAAIMVGDRVGVRPRSNIAERARAGDSPGAAARTHRHRCRAAMTGNRPVSAADHYRVGLSDRAARGRGAAIV